MIDTYAGYQYNNCCYFGLESWLLSRISVSNCFASLRFLGIIVSHIVTPAWSANPIYSRISDIAASGTLWKRDRCTFISIFNEVKFWRCLKSVFNKLKSSIYKKYTFWALTRIQKNRIKKYVKYPIQFAPINRNRLEFPFWTNKIKIGRASCRERV